MAIVSSDKNTTAAGVKTAVDVLQVSDGLVLTLGGFWTTHRIGVVDEKMRSIASRQAIKLTFDLSSLRGLDTAGAWLVERTAREMKAKGAQIIFTGLDEQHKILLDAVANAPAAGALKARSLSDNVFASFFAKLGQNIFAFWDDILRSMNILGATIQGAQMKIGRSHGVSPAAIVHQIDRMGIRAFPVVILMSFIIGAIIAQQGAFQLRYFGAEIFVVDLVGVLVLREIGVLLTAIMVAGRSGSAITAEIGSMKMREEIDALQVIGLNPIGVLVFPRLVALVVALPILTIIADLSALLGASLVAWSYSGITPSAFVSRLQEAIDLSTYFAGLIKAPFMALIIGVVASVEGLKVGGSAESLGQKVTTSVVKAIFVVIVIDGLFAMFYAAIDF
jgi:phospholipid/cholesterol/gamma-HCH transport system permease protein